VAHAYNPSYAGGTDQEDQTQPGQMVCETLSQKNHSQKRTGTVAQGVGPEFKTQNCKKVYIYPQSISMMQLSDKPRLEDILQNPWPEQDCQGHEKQRLQNSLETTTG
jgi:hypothetical protein